MKAFVLASGDNFGQEFAFPKGEAMQIAKEVNQPVPTTYATSESALTTARVGTVDRVGTESEIPTGTAAAQTPVETVQNTPPPAPEPTATPAATPQSMPRTGSPYPMVALFGLASLLGAAVLSLASKKA
jgi:hypothetical protein